MIRVRSLVTVGVAALALSCSASAPEESASEASIGTSSSPIIKGEDSDDSQNAVVLLVHYDPAQPNGVSLCSGSLLAPSLVLTARHCVANTSESAACDVEGNPIGAGQIRGNNDPNTMYVFTGKNLPKFSTGRVVPDSTGAQIIDDGAKNLCNHDIALLVLDTPITDMPIVPVRVDSDVTVGEEVTSIGWGVTDKASTPSVRQQRAGVSILEVGPADSRRLPVPPNEFEVGESICSGDSGGPAIAASGAVVGVVSRGGNGKEPSQSDPSVSCIGDSATNLYTKLSPFKDLLLQAYEAAGAEPWFEGEPDPRKAKDGEACAEATDCRSNLCVADSAKDGATTCATDCSSTPCTGGLVCSTEGAAHVCRAPAATSTTTTTTSGCSAASTARTPGGAFLSALGVALGLATIRRRARLGSRRDGRQ